MARGAAAAPAAPSPAPAPGAPADTPPAIPEKYHVKREDGSTDWEATALKQAQGYDSLAKRLGAGEAPPKTPEDYQLTLPDGISMDVLKNDAKFAGFLKGAHARGLNNAQVSWAISEFQQRMAPSPEEAELELRKDFTSDQALTQALQRSYRATATYAGNDETRARLDAKFGNDPDFIKLMARIGGELGEDAPPQGLSTAEAETLESLMSHPGYLDAKHPEHQRLVTRARVLYNKKTGGT